MANKNLFARGPPANKKLFAGGPPANKKLFAGGPPENKKLFAGGRSANKKLFARDSPENKTFGSVHILINHLLLNSGCPLPPPCVIDIRMALTPPKNDYMIYEQGRTALTTIFLPLLNFV